MAQSRSTSRRAALIGGAIAVAVGYYVACQVGLSLRLPGETPSVLWPPNAILTSALLLSPPRRWPLLLLAALPVHVVLELNAGFSPSLIFALFVTNCMEAVIGAGGMWLLSDAPSQFDTFSRLTAFFVSAVFAGPLLSSFVDAAAVSVLHGEVYWDVFRTRLLSNILSELTVVPAVVGALAGLPHWLRLRWTAHATEAVILAVGLIGVAFTGLRGEFPHVPWLRVVSSQTPLALQLPFLLWAAVRFGPVGTGLALLTTTVLGAWSLVHGFGPFAPVSPTTTVIALTLSLIVVAMTLMTLSTLVEERRTTQHALASRLRFEEQLSRFSGAFVQLPSDQMDRAFDAWLGRLADALGVDVLALFVAGTEQHNFRSVHFWGAQGFPAAPELIAGRDFPWALETLHDHQPFVVPDLDALPPDATTDRATMERLGLRAGFAVPLAGKQGFLGVLACGSFMPRRWSDDLRVNVRLVSEVLANVLVRKQAEDALRTSEIMKSAILQSLTTGVAVVDRLGSVVALNESWTRLADENGGLDVSLGDNLLLSCEAAARAGDPLARALAPGVAAVVGANQHRFFLDHRSESGLTPRWWSILVEPLGSGDGGAVIARTDVTDVRLAELEAQRSRQELAHVARVSTVGELTASLAHQLNQPLGAIMTNAQAARRMLDSPSPDVAKLHAILVDIVKDDRRASDIIVRLRKLLRRGELAMTRVNLTSLIREVADLVVGDAIVRAVTVSVDLDREPVFVQGDSVQLQQVVLNLLQNAMDAVGDQSDGSRLVTVRCSRPHSQAVRVSMHDTGPGLPAGTEDMVFEPFYTTKPGGMGMGLSIVRSILEAHGGSIRAANHEGRGAVFEFDLPLDGNQAS
jgi:signal transduction histidine kinase/integral membrane sensor domain MASE1